MEKKGGSQPPWDQCLSPPRSTESPRKLLKCTSKFGSFSLKSNLTVVGGGSGITVFQNSLDDSAGQSGLKTTVLLLTILEVQPSSRMCPPQIPYLLGDPTKPVRLHQLNRAAWTFWPECLSILFAPPGASPRLWRLPHSPGSPSPHLQNANPIDLEPASVLSPHPWNSSGRLPQGHRSPQGTTR